MTYLHRPTSLLLCGLVLMTVACARTGAPAPVEIRGVGNNARGSVVSEYPSSASSDYSSPEPVMGGGYVPPRGYGNNTAGSSIQAESLSPEPNDPYAQAAQGQRAPTSALPSTTQQAPMVLTPDAANSPAGTAAMPQSPTTQPSFNTVPSAPSSTPLNPSAALDQGSGSYGWPLRGRLISGFGVKPDGQKNDGLNIAAPLGTSVVAAKNGSVAYAGNELRGFGNVVLIKHAGGMFTVYAHLDQISVSKNQQISKGQVVGTVGQSGGVSEPQLHFEVRQNSTPQDPMKYLSR